MANDCPNDKVEWTLDKFKPAFAFVDGHHLTWDALNECWRDEHGAEVSLTFNVNNSHRETDVSKKQSAR